MWREVVLACSAIVMGSLCTAQQQFDCSDGEMRLVGGKYAYEGRVEICFSGLWGTVCDDIWNSLNAQVVCNQLGFNFSAALAAGRSHYGDGTGPIYLDNVDCVGTEARLVDCLHGGINIHNCRHSEDAGVFCQPLDQACDGGDLRLVGGELENEGRVEVCVNRQWGTICDDRWDNKEAMVVCRQLGFPGDDAIAVPRALYGMGIGDIVYDDLECRGTEDNLTECGSRGIGNHNCQHLEDAGVLCEPTSNTMCSNGDLRLAGGRNPMEGRVEVCYNGRWGTVCDDLFGNSDAVVVCNQLGYSSGAYGLVRAAFGEGQGPIFLDNLNCIGNETKLINCKNDGVGLHNCQHNEDSSVVCIAPVPICTEGAVQLMDGDLPSEGRVEVCVKNHWGTVCDDDFESAEAQVTCNQLGYTNGEAISVQAGYFGVGRGIIWLDDLECTGNETRLVDCNDGDVGDANCRHNDDANVICPVPSNVSPSRCRSGDVRLMNGTVSNEGLVEVCYNGRWGAICQDDWDTADATVVCNQLGFPGDSSIPVARSFFASSSGPIFLDNAACVGNETRLLDCFSRDQLGIHDCSSSEHAGVICPARQKSCENGEIRLVDGGTLLEGRVEMCYNSRWGTVCDSLWDNNDAMVVCRQLAAEYGLELNTINAVSVTSSAFGRGEGPIFLKDVRCLGSESSLLECNAAAVGIHDCGNHNQDAGAYCGLQPCDEGDIRLSRGLPGTNNTGLVEMCIRNVWSALCDKQFDDRAAQFVCTKLGLSYKNVLVVGGDFFGHAHIIPTWSVKYVCVVNSNSQRTCSLQPDSLQTECPHVGVFCEQLRTQCKSGDVRLVGGANSSEGRVEVCINNHWGKVCDDSWEDNAATVVCKQLGLPTLGATAKLESSFGMSPSLGFLLDDVKCSGKEARLLQCQSSAVLSHNCLASEEAGVTCHGRLFNTVTTDKPGKLTNDNNNDDNEGRYSSGQVAAIILPIIVLVVLVMVGFAVGVWLVLQWRKRSMKQSDQFPIIADEGIVQFREFSDEENIDKPLSTAEASDL